MSRDGNSGSSRQGSGPGLNVLSGNATQTSFKKRSQVSTERTIGTRPTANNSSLGSTGPLSDTRYLKEYLKSQKGGNRELMNRSALNMQNKTEGVKFQSLVGKSPDPK